MNPPEIKRKRGEGRRKIEIKRIEEEKKRQVCFSKRRQCLFKKASELSTLCGAEVAVVAFSTAGKPYFFDQPSVDHVLSRFHSPSDMMLPATSCSEPVNEDRSVGESFWWDVDLHSMGFEDLSAYQEILLKQNSAVDTKEAQQSFFQAPEAAALPSACPEEGMQQIEALPSDYLEVEEVDFFLGWEQDDDFLNFLNSVPI